MQNVRYCNNGDTGFRIIAESPNTNDFSLCYLPLAVCQVPLFFPYIMCLRDEDILYSDT